MVLAKYLYVDVAFRSSSLMPDLEQESKEVTIQTNFIDDSSLTKSFIETRRWRTCIKILECMALCLETMVIEYNWTVHFFPFQTQLFLAQTENVFLPICSVHIYATHVTALSISKSCLQTGFKITNILLHLIQAARRGFLLHRNSIFPALLELVLPKSYFRMKAHLFWKFH